MIQKKPEHPYKPIDCGDYDFLEIACLDRYRVRIEISKASITGVAVDTQVRSGGEYFVIRLDDGNAHEVRVDQIRRLIVLSEPRRFAEHVFAKNLT